MDCTTLRDCFTESLREIGKKKAIAFQRGEKIETEITYEELNLDTNRLANAFLDAGIEKGDRVILLMQKSLFFIVGHLALQKIGAISVPLNPGFKKSELEYLLADSDPKMVLSDVSLKKIVEEIDAVLRVMVIDTRLPYAELDLFGSASGASPAVDIEADDPGLIIYTSGTTGKPKGAVLTQRNLVHDARNIMKIWQITESDVLCHALPLFHVHGLCFALHTSLLAGASVLLFDRYSPETVIEALKEKEGNYVCTLFMAVPPMYGKMMDYLDDMRPDFNHIRLWTSGSAPLLVKDFHRIKGLFKAQHGAS